MRGYGYGLGVGVGVWVGWGVVGGEFGSVTHSLRYKINHWTLDDWNSAVIIRQRWRLESGGKEIARGGGGMGYSHLLRRRTATMTVRTIMP